MLKEIGSCQICQMPRCFLVGEKKIVGNSQLENYESYMGQLTSIVFFLFFGKFCKGVPERR